MYGLARPLLFAFDAERAHGLGLASLEAAYRSGMNPLLAAAPKPLPTRAFGLEFPSPAARPTGLGKRMPKAVTGRSSGGVATKRPRRLRWATPSP